MGKYDVMICKVVKYLEENKVNLNLKKLHTTYSVDLKSFTIRGELTSTKESETIFVCFGFNSNDDSFLFGRLGLVSLRKKNKRPLFTEFGLECFDMSIENQYEYALLELLNIINDEENKGILDQPKD